MSAYRPPEAYVHGEGAVVVVPQRVAHWLDRNANLSRLRATVRGADPEVDAVLVALRVSAMAWATSVGGTDPRKEPELQALSAVMNTTDVATALGITDRGVRTAIADGRLTAEQVDGRWRITRTDFEHYRAARRAT